MNKSEKIKWRCILFLLVNAWRYSRRIMQGCIINHGIVEYSYTVRDVEMQGIKKRATSKDVAQKKYETM